MSTIKDDVAVPAADATAAGLDTPLSITVLKTRHAPAMLSLAACLGPAAPPPRRTRRRMTR